MAISREKNILSIMPDVCVCLFTSRIWKSILLSPYSYHITLLRIATKRLLVKFFLILINSMFDKVLINCMGSLDVQQFLKSKGRTSAWRMLQLHFQIATSYFKLLLQRSIITRLLWKVTFACWETTLVFIRKCQPLLKVKGMVKYFWC